MRLPQELIEGVEQKVAELLPGRLHSLMLRQHCNTAWKRGCECSYCVLKKESTLNLRFRLRSSDWLSRKLSYRNQLKNLR